MNAATPVVDLLAPGSLPYSVWRETRILPRCRLAAFHNAGDAILFAEMRADREEGRIDTTIWMLCGNGAEKLLVTYPAKAAI